MMFKGLLFAFLAFSPTVMALQHPTSHASKSSSKHAQRRRLPAHAEPGLLITGVMQQGSRAASWVVELCAIRDVDHLDDYSLGSPLTGEMGRVGGPHERLTAGECLYLTGRRQFFARFFDFDFDRQILGLSGGVAGFAPFKLYVYEEVIDSFGDVDDMLSWNYNNGWAYRKDRTGPDGDEADLHNWYFSGEGALEDAETNKDAGDDAFPYGTYVSSRIIMPNEDYQQHYLVGLLNYPNSAIPDILNGVTSGTLLGPDRGPYNYIPSVGFSDMEAYYDEEGRKVRGEFFCLSDNGFGSSANSGDYALNIVHMKIQKPFTYRHGESTFEKYTETENLGTALVHDPNGYIGWENGADIQVAYYVPDETWDAYRELRVLTGRDFDLEGLAVIDQHCAVLGDELMPAIFSVDPSTGVVKSPFVRTPDIDENGEFNGKYLSTRGDKVHCSIEDLENNDCPAVDSSVVDESMYRKHDPSGGYEGFSLLADGSIAAFIEKQTGDTTLGDEPGIRVYRVQPGDCTPENYPYFEEFLGYYPLELNAGNIADVSAIPGSSSKVLVIERNGFPNGFTFPSPVMPANKACVVDLLDVDDNMVMRNKKCILNYHDIDDPWDVDGNGIFKYAQTQVTNEALIVVDDYCIVAGTDTNFPFVNQFRLDPDQVPFFQEVSDTRFMIVCFLEPIFDPFYPILDDHYYEYH